MGIFVSEPLVGVRIQQWQLCQVWQALAGSPRCAVCRIHLKRSHTYTRSQGKKRRTKLSIWMIRMIQTMNQLGKRQLERKTQRKKNQCHLQRRKTLDQKNQKVPAPLRHHQVQMKSKRAKLRKKMMSKRRRVAMMKTKSKKKLTLASFCQVQLSCVLGHSIADVTSCELTLVHEK